MRDLRAESASFRNLLGPLAACTSVVEPLETCQDYYYPVFNRSKQMFALLIAHLIKAPRISGGSPAETSAGQRKSSDYSALCFLIASCFLSLQ